MRCYARKAILAAIELRVATLGQMPSTETHWPKWPPADQAFAVCVRPIFRLVLIPKPAYPPVCVQRRGSTAQPTAESRISYNYHLYLDTYTKYKGKVEVV
jgi:hypothetical protein